jgi:non-specific serine/threonine protein kinase
VPPSSTTTFGATLRRHRHAAGFTQESLAERAGLSVYGIQKLERGITHPYRDTAERLLAALELDGQDAERFRALAEPVRRRGSMRRESPSDVPHDNLPATLTSFVGREEQIARLQRLLDPRASHSLSARLITLTGAGGCGKTRLAIELARHMLAKFPDGVWFADLSSITDTTLVSVVVLNAVGGPQSSDQAPLQSLLRRLHGRTLLLVLDNCEHLIEACAELVDAVLGASPEVSVLATSREALRVPGETAWRVPSLDAPHLATFASPGQLLEYAAVQLFLDRVHQVEPEFSLTDSNARALADICNRLDGIPLAIELAAAAGTAMSVQEIAERLDDRFQWLTGGSRTALERHRTLRATIDWSYELLSTEEQTLFRRLAVFAGGWTLEAAEMICDDPPLLRSDILPVLKRLIDQSLVSVHGEDGRTRYRYLETVRAYAAELLRASGEAATVQQRHCAWCVGVAERATRGLLGPDSLAWFRLLTTEHDNVRAALDWCALAPTATEAELRLVAAMGAFWWPRKPGEGRLRLAVTLQRAAATPSSSRAEALYWQGYFERTFGDPLVGRNLVSLALADARAVGDAQQVVWALFVLAQLTEEDDAAGRIGILEEGVALARRSENTVQVTFVLPFLAAALAEAGDTRRARVLLDECGAYARAIGDTFSGQIARLQLGWLAIAEGNLDDAESHLRSLIAPSGRWGTAPIPAGLLALGQVCLLRGDLEQTRALCCEGLVQLREVEPGGLTMANALVDMACVEAVAGRHARAQRLLGANEAWYAGHGGMGHTWRHSSRSALKQGLVPIPPVPTDASLVQARADGRLMSLDEAVAFALQDVIPADIPTNEEIGRDRLRNVQKWGDGYVTALHA